MNSWYLQFNKTRIILYLSNLNKYNANVFAQEALYNIYIKQNFISTQNNRDNDHCVVSYSVNKTTKTHYKLHKTFRDPQQDFQ